MRARNLSGRTIQTYVESADIFADWLATHGRTAELQLLTKTDVEDFVIAYAEGRKPTSVSVRYRALQQLFRWAVEEDELEANPMATMRAPKVPEILVPLVTVEELVALLKCCDGTSFVDRRDNAIIRLFIDSGLRLSELAGLAVDDIDFAHNVVVVMGKGRRPRECPFGHRTAVALDRYVRARGRHRQAFLPALWLGERGKGPMTGNGIGQMVRRRGREAEIKDLHPHAFRHTWADAWLRSDGAEFDLQRLAGWQSGQMVGRYARINADRRAREAHRQRSFGDQF